MVVAVHARQWLRDALAAGKSWKTFLSKTTIRTLAPPSDLQATDEKPTATKMSPGEEATAQKTVNEIGAHQKCRLTEGRGLRTS